MSVNKAILVGFVGIDPDVRYLDSGTAVCNFRMATSETYKNKNGELVTSTEWHNIVLWRRLAEIAEKYVKKGSQLYIEGRIRTRSWDDRDGNKRYTTEIVGDNMQMLGKPSSDYSASPDDQERSVTPSENTNNSSENTSNENLSENQGSSDDLPF